MNNNPSIANDQNPTGFPEKVRASQQHVIYKGETIGLTPRNDVYQMITGNKPKFTPCILSYDETSGAIITEKVTPKYGVEEKKKGDVTYGFVEVCPMHFDWQKIIVE